MNYEPLAWTLLGWAAAVCCYAAGYAHSQMDSVKPLVQKKIFDRLENSSQPHGKRCRRVNINPRRLTDDPE